MGFLFVLCGVLFVCLFLNKAIEYLLLRVFVKGNNQNGETKLVVQDLFL